MDIAERLKSVMRGEVSTTDADLESASRDTSLFVRMPKAVAYPKDAEDVASAVRAIADAKKAGEDVALAARAAGTDMSGGPLTDSVVLSFTKHMQRIDDLECDAECVAGTMWTEPGVYYRDFEKATIAKGLIMPSYPASRELAAMGGIVANDSGGEKTLAYGKTHDYVEELEVVLADGTRTSFKALTKTEVAQKKLVDGLEGRIYRELDKLLSEHADVIETARPKVSKNSAGYALWDVRTTDGGMNLAKLIAGSQGTLVLWTRAKLRLVKPKAHRAMLIVFLNEVPLLPEVVKRILPFSPESFESYDDHTFTLAVKFLPEMLSQMGWTRAARLGISFIPEAEMVLLGGVPKLVLMAEFAEDTIEEADAKAEQARVALAGLDLKSHIEKDEAHSEKYWIVRRESFRLLRKNLRGTYASPFIDDFVVPTDSYDRFLPELHALLDEYKDSMVYTVAGHIGNGNFHIIPLMDLKNPEARTTVLELAPRVYDLVIRYGGTTTGEHNDGIIRTPYLEKLFGSEMVQLFQKTKTLFDPLNILNPGKKVGGTSEDIERFMIPG
ncbi:MAG: FAD-binding oxidoreductase [Candidatus Pacebacteria bacterium]|nr:FAD-binding oxidoreductase [Candidatus Paceibacterota bacterium]MBP9840655.1 FAD-binding oxidoreductase [Candidatus Paceibacterota bacterium]